MQVVAFTAAKLPSATSSMSVQKEKIQAGHGESLLGYNVAYGTGMIYLESTRQVSD